MSLSPLTPNSIQAGSSLEDKIITIAGGSGFIGLHLAQELLARGARLRIASRYPRKAYAIKPLGNLGQVQFVGIDVTKPETIAPAFVGSYAVINLVGALNGNLDAVQGAGAGIVAAAAKATGVSAYVHVSALGADANSELTYARTKGEGENAVRAAFPDATIVRPSIVFGPDDNFIMMLGDLISRMPAVPIFVPEAKLQPVFVDDVASAIANALENPATTGGKTFELAGPEVLTMADLNHRINAAQSRSRCFPEVPDALAGLLATVGSLIPGVSINSDQIKLLKAGSVASGNAPSITDLGVNPRPLGLFLDRWMTQFRHHGRFGTKTAA